MNYMYQPQVTVEPSKGRAKFIHVEGCKYNVKDALLEISQLFTRIQKEETEKQKMEHLAKEVSADIMISDLYVNNKFVCLIKA